MFAFAIYLFLIWARKRDRHRDLAMSLLFLVLGFNDIFQSFVYASASPAEAIPWLRLSSAAAGLAAPFFLWFLAEYTAMVPKRALALVAVFFTIYSAMELLAPGDIAWIASRPLHIVAKLPFLPEFSVQQVASGPLDTIQIPATMALILYCMVIIRRFSRSGRRREARGFAGVLAVVLAAVLNDNLVDAGAYRFIFLTEYAWALGLVFLTYQSSQEIIAGGEALQRLDQSEARLRAMVEHAPFNIWICDADGRLILQNSADIAAVGEHVGQRYEDWNGPEKSPSVFAEISRRALSGEVVDENLTYDVGGTSRVFRDIIAPALSGNAIIGSVGVGIDITEQVRSKAELEARLAEKEILLREIHHRVKNNLQVVASLVNIRGDSLKDRAAKEIFIAVQGQVDAIARVHESLYNSDNLATIDFGEYLGKLVSDLVSMRGREGIALSLDLESLSLDIDSAIPCALIAHELVMNSLKHAFCERESGRLAVSFRRRGKDGRPSRRGRRLGHPRRRIVPTEGASIGMVLVSSLTAQLRGGSIDPRPATESGGARVPRLGERGGIAMADGFSAPAAWASRPLPLRAFGASRACS